MSLKECYLQHGAQLAPDGIPLHFGDLAAEYQAALDNAILLDRSHEGRLELKGKDRFELLNRMSTNDTLNLGQGKPTIFTNANARILDRIEVFHWSDDSLLLITGPGRGEAVQRYLQRNIFFNDDAVLTDLNPTTHQFTLHGPQATAIINELMPSTKEQTAGRTTINDVSVFVAKLKPFVESHWVVVSPKDQADVVWQALAEHTTPAGGLTYNTLRIRAGYPGIGFELTNDYIPLELGLWDEISFNKGCYTGQEIIARMESRGRLARTIVSIKPSQSIKAPADLFHDGRNIGKITSSVTAPDGEHFAIGVVKVAVANPDQALHATQPDGIPVQVGERLGIQPEYLEQD